MVCAQEGRSEMDRYQRVEKPREEAPINENEIRVTTQGRMRNYISYAISLFQVSFQNPFRCSACSYRKV